jgi:PAS domain S-box-containing protein
MIAGGVMEEPRISRLLDLVDGGAFVLKDGSVEFASAGLLRMLHLRQDQVLGRKATEVFPERLWSVLECELAKLGSPRSRSVERDLEWEDAVAGSVMLRFRALRQGDRSMVVVSPVPAAETPDLDGRMDGLRDRLGALLGFVANAGIGIVFLERVETGELRIRSANSHFCSLIGRPEQELIGKDPCDLVHPDERAKAKEDMARFWSEEAITQPVHLRLIDSSGEAIHVQVSTSLLSPPSGNVALCFVQDVSAIDLVLEEQRKFALAIESVQETVVLADGMGRIFYANPAALRNSGYTLEEVMGKSVAIFQAPESVGPVAGPALQEFMRQGWWRGDLMACRKDGRRYPVEVSGSLVRDRTGRPSMIIIVSRKIEERQRYEAELLMARRHVEYLKSLLERDLTRTLETLIGTLERTKGQSVDSEGLRQELEAIVKELSTVKALTEEATEVGTDLKSARTLRPMSLTAYIKERLPPLIQRYGVGRIHIDLDIPEENVEVMANDLLMELLARLHHVIMIIAPEGRLDTTLSVRKAPPPDSPKAPPAFAHIAFTLPGLRLSDEARGAFSRREVPLRLRGVGGDFSNAVETANLITFLSGGQVFFEDIDTARPELGVQLVLLLPLAGEPPRPSGTPMTLTELEARRRKGPKGGGRPTQATP